MSASTQLDERERGIPRGTVGRARRKQWLAAAFPHAPDHLLRELSTRLTARRYAPGEVIVAEGAPADAFFVVTHGEAEVTQLNDGAPVHVCTYQPGSFFGETGLLTLAPRNATVRATSPVKVLSLDRHTFHQAVQRSLDVAEEMTRIVEERGIRTPTRPDGAPLPPWSRLRQRMLKHPRAMHYNRLILLVLLVNVVVLVHALGAGWWTISGNVSGKLAAIALTAQTNFALAILLRQQYVINGLAWLATRPPTSWPLRIRWMLGKYYHFGGLHVGAAIAGTLWYAGFVGALTYGYARGTATVQLTNVVLSYAIVGLFVVMVVLATPKLRAAAHDNFEVTHRFCGWATLVLIWANTVVFVRSQHASLMTAPTMWLLVITTIGAAWPWLLLRKVPITVQRPSTHAVVIGLDHGVTPPIGSTRPISRHPLVGWHHFANVPVPPGTPGYRMVISRAGDWTTDFIDNPPEAVWLRGIPTMGVATVRTLFTKVVFVATGSGIGPMLGHLLTREPPSRLVWVTKDPRKTYGDDLVDEIEEAQPDATIWNTSELGKPDVLRLAYAAYLDSDAEAVIVIANRKVTWQIVHGLERRGIPAFGPIWDS
jgi:hypothetical protein